MVIAVSANNFIMVLYTLKAIAMLFIIIIAIAVSIHTIRDYKLHTLQKKRNKLDLTTKEGRLKLMEYNERINRLMNYDNPEGNDNRNNGKRS